MEQTEARRLSVLLEERIRAHYPRFRIQSSIDKWEKDMNILIRQGTYSLTEIEDVLVWSQQHRFWRDVIESPSGLRNNFQRMHKQKEKMDGMSPNRDMSTITTGKSPCISCGSTTYSSSTEGQCRNCRDGASV